MSVEYFFDLFVPERFGNENAGFKKAVVSCREKPETQDNTRKSPVNDDLKTGVRA